MEFGLIKTRVLVIFKKRKLNVKILRLIHQIRVRGSYRMHERQLQRVPCHRSTNCMDIGTEEDNSEHGYKF
jgi:hypothetical protein